MKDGRLQYIKRELKRTYKRCMGEDPHKMATVADVATYFNIPVERDRIEDYYVDSIDLANASIVIVDEGTMSSYRAKYTDRVSTLGVFGSDVMYVHVTKYSKGFQIDSAYKIVSHDARDNFHLVQNSRLKMAIIFLLLGKREGQLARMLSILTFIIVKWWLTRREDGRNEIYYLGSTESNPVNGETCFSSERTLAILTQSIFAMIGKISIVILAQMECYTEVTRI